MSRFETGSWVWITDPKDCYVPAKVTEPFRPGEKGKVLTEDGEVSDPGRE